MRVAGVFSGALWILVTAACGGTSESNESTTTDADAATTNAAESAPAAAVVDPEFEQLKSVTPVDACSWLTADKLGAVFPGLTFAVHQELEPQMSGYVWDSRCVYWAGVGTIDYAKDVPTHTVDFFVATSATAEKAQANLMSRFEMAGGATGYQAQPELGEGAHNTANTGVVSLFFVKGQSEVQINFSDLDTPPQEKVTKVVALARSL
jgi:hypothetical protein